MGRNKMVANRKLVAFRLLSAQVRLLDKASKIMGQSKTLIVEQAIANRLTQLHLDGVL